MRQVLMVVARWQKKNRKLDSLSNANDNNTYSLTSFNLSNSIWQNSSIASL